MNMHIGQEIDKKFQESGMKLAEFAKRVGTSTRNIYSIMNRSDINSELLRKISEVLKYDFFALYQDSLSSNVVSEPEMKYTMRKKVSLIVELDGQSETLENWFDIMKKLNKAI